MTISKTKHIKKLTAPFAKQVEIMEVLLEHDITFLRIRIKEGSRFTILDLDPVSALEWGESLVGWAKTRPDGRV